MTSIAPNPADAHVAYIGTADGGVWKTIDDGARWTPLFDAQPTLAIGAAAVDPQHPKTVYAGTGEANVADSYFGDGLFRSDDGGKSWTRIDGDLFTGCTIPAVVFEPGHPHTIMVAVRATSQFGNTHCRTPADASGALRSGVYRSIDGGKDWTLVLKVEPTDIAVDPSNPHLWYVGAENFGFSAGGIYRSAADGAPGTWMLMRRGAPDGAVVGRVALGMAADGSVLHAAVASAFDDTLLFLGKLHGGLKWKPLPTPAEASVCNEDSGSAQCLYDLALAVTPANPDTFYLGGSRLFKYTAGGAAHSKVGSGSDGIHTDVHALVFDRDNRLWVGTDGGVYRTGGKRGFHDINANLALTQFNAGASVAGTAVVGGTQDNGTVRVEGPDWQGILEGDGGASAIDPTNHDVIYASTQTAVIWKTTDGTTFKRVFPVVDAKGDPRLFYAPMVMDPANAGRLVVGTDRVWETTNSASTWSAVSPHFAPSLIASLALAPSNADTIYAGLTRGDGMVRTIDGGTTWDSVSGLPLNAVYSVTDIAVDPNDAHQAFATLDGFGHGHVFHTTSGSIWSDISGNLPDGPANAVVFDNATSTLYVATDTGVFASTDEGASWQRFGTGLPTLVVADLVLDPVDHELFAFTHGRGAFSHTVVVPDASCMGKPATIQGTSAADSITGTPGDDVIVGGAGNDSIDGREGNDLICAGDGADSVYGDDGNDTIAGEGGDDSTLDGGAGDDTISAGPGNDIIAGGEGDDVVTGDDGADVLSGGPGKDSLNGGPGGDVIHGDADDDSLSAGVDTVKDELFGDDGTDTCVGGPEDVIDASCEV